MTVLKTGSITLLPVVPATLEFSAVVRRAILTLQPARVAVQLWRGLELETLSAIARLPELSAVAWSPDGAEFSNGEEDDEDGARQRYHVIEVCDADVEAIRSAREIGAEVLFLLERPPQAAGPLTPLPDPYAGAKAGMDEYLRRLLDTPFKLGSGPTAVVEEMAWKLRRDSSVETLAVVDVRYAMALLLAIRGQARQSAGTPVRRTFNGELEAELINLHPETLAEVTIVPPFYAERYEAWRRSPDEPPPDRLQLQRELLRESELNYNAQTHETVAPWQRRQMARFSRKLARSSSLLLPDLFDLVTAARGVVDDNYAWEIWNAANQWPWQREQSDRETRKLTSEDLSPWTRRMRLRRMPPREKRMRLPRGLQRRPKERFPGEWATQVDGDAICSYPPEDLVIEDYGRMLRGKARSLLTEERTHVEPFTTSLLDGIDVRETIRNWSQGEIWVRRAQRAAGDVGAVVVIFDEDLKDTYSYCTTWLGEHQNESDMAFYSTPPFDHMVGPGIGRGEYGGFLMVLPSRRLFDVWGDPDYEMAETKAERLLLAGLDYSLERHVLYVAAKPPRSIFRTVAARLGRSVLYLPIGQLSSAKLKRIRVVHVLDGHQRRAGAKQYLW